MKNFRTLLIYLAVAFLLGGYIYFFERGPVKSKDEEKKIKVFDNFVADDITEIQLENLGTTVNAQKSPVEIKKDDKGVWQIVSPKKVRADEANIRSLLSGVGDFTPDTTIDNPANLADYGLNSPNARSTFKTKSGTVFQLLVGNTGMSGSSIYAKRSDKNTVYLLPSYTIESLKKPLNNYRDHSFIKTDTVLAQKIQITRDGKVFTFEKDKDHAWNITDPIHDKADESKIRDLLNNVNNLRADDFVSDNPSGLSSYGLSKPHARVEIWPSDGGPSKSIWVGRKKEKTTSYFAKGGDSPAVALVGEFFDKSIDVKPAEYRDKSVMKFDVGTVKSLTVKRNGNATTYQKGDKGQWTAVGREKAQDEATNLLNLLSQTAISDFAAKDTITGLKTPSFVAEVILNDGTTRTYRFGKREKEQVFLASDKTKDVYLVPSGIVSQMESYFSTILTPVPASSPSPTPKK